MEASANQQEQTPINFYISTWDILSLSNNIDKQNAAPT